MEFRRVNYYSQTEITKTFNISLKQLNKLITDNQITPVTKDVDLGLYSVKAKYYIKNDIDKLDLPKRPL